MTFPADIPTLTSPHGTLSGGTDKLSTPGVIHGSKHQETDGLVTAIMTKVGIDGSAVSSTIDYKLKSPSSSNPGHVHTTAAITDFSSVVAGILIDYIRKDGLTTCTASIPFAVGWSAAGNISIDKATPTFTWKYSGVTSVTMSSSTTAFTIQGGSDSSGVNGADIVIIAGTAPFGGGGSGAFTRLKGGAFDAGGDILNNGFVTVGTTITGFNASNTVTGVLQAGNTVNDLAVEGSTYLAGAVIVVADGIGVGGRLNAVGYMLLGKGTANMIIGMDRATVNPGFNLTIQAGWAFSGSTNQNAGSLILACGKVTGSGTGSVLIQAAGGGGSGSADGAPTTVSTWAKTTMTLVDGYTFSTGTVTGLKIGSSSSEKIGLWGVTPVAQQANTIGIEIVLSNIGARVAGSAAPITIGVFSSTSTTDSTSPTTGGGKFSGGVGIAKALWVGTNISINTAGNGLAIKGGANAKIGTGTLVAGTVVINTTAVTANSIIIVTDTGNGVVGNIGALRADTIVAATSFAVTSTNPLDTSTFNWIIFEKL